MRATVLSACHFAQGGWQKGGPVLGRDCKIAAARRHAACECRCLRQADTYLTGQPFEKPESRHRRTKVRPSVPVLRLVDPCDLEIVPSFARRLVHARDLFLEFAVSRIAFCLSGLLCRSCLLAAFSVALAT